MSPQAGRPQKGRAVSPSEAYPSNGDPSHVRRDLGARPVSRRRVLAGAGALAGLGALAACGARPPAGPASSPVGPSSPQVARFAAAQARPGAPVRDYTLTARPEQVDLGGVTVPTWTYGTGTVPGPLLRGTTGDQLRVALANQLPGVSPDGAPSGTSVHWHGLAIRNDMDGVPDVTQPSIAPGTTANVRLHAAPAGQLLVPLPRRGATRPRPDRAADRRRPGRARPLRHRVHRGARRLDRRRRRGHPGRGARRSAPHRHAHGHGLHGRHDGGRPGLGGRRGRRRCRLPLLPGQRAHPRLADGVRRAARAAGTPFG